MTTIYEPYDYTQLDEIVLFKGKPNSDTIELTREKQYINLIKEKEKHKKYYRYNLNKKTFERLNFYKTKENTIKEVKTKNITGWFKDCKIITRDLHFGRLIIFAKFNHKFSRYSSPVRFIEQLGDKSIAAIEQWEALGFIIEEVHQFFGNRLVQKINGQTVDLRKKIYEGEDRFYSWTTISYYGYIDLTPSDFSKEVFQYIKRKYTKINKYTLHRLHEQYNKGEYHIEKKLKQIEKDPEFAGIFHYENTRMTTSYYRNTPPTFWAFGTNYESKRIRNNIMTCIQEFNLDLISLCKWLKKQKNIDKNDVQYLFGTGHYYDYLTCEKDLCDGKLSKMTKYPNNFRTQFHRTQTEYMAKKAIIDEKKFYEENQKNKTLEHKGKKYQVILPNHTKQIHEEAQELNHCVRMYIPKVVKGETIIAFLRDKKHPNTPLITLEIKQGALTQAYGKNDKKPQNEHLQYLKKYCKNKNIKVACWKKDLM